MKQKISLPYHIKKEIIFKLTILKKRRNDFFKARAILDKEKKENNGKEAKFFTYHSQSLLRSSKDTVMAYSSAAKYLVTCLYFKIGIDEKEIDSFYKLLGSENKENHKIAISMIEEHLNEFLPS